MDGTETDISVEKPTGKRAGLGILKAIIYGILLVFALAVSTAIALTIYPPLWFVVAAGFLFIVVREFRRGKTARPAAWILCTLFVLSTLVTAPAAIEAYVTARAKHAAEDQKAAATAAAEKTEADRLAKLKATDPQAYLQEIKAKNGETAWLYEARTLDSKAYLEALKEKNSDNYLSELQALDPASYAAEKARVDAEKKKAEDAEKTRLAALRKSDPHAYLDAIKGQDVWEAEFKKLDPKGYKSWQQQQAEAQDELDRLGTRLELKSPSWHEEYGYAVAEGSVTNLTDEPMRNVLAVAVFYDQSGNVITSDSALIQYQVLLPGQTSPFKVMANWNPAMKTSSTEFQEFGGGTIPTYYKKKK